MGSDPRYRGVRLVPYHSHYGDSRTSSSDLGYSGSRTASSDSVCGGSATAAASTSTSHLVEGYRKMTLQPHEEGKL